MLVEAIDLVLTYTRRTSPPSTRSFRGEEVDTQWANRPLWRAPVEYSTARLVRILRVGTATWHPDGEIEGRRCGRGYRGSLSPLMPPSTARMVPVVDADIGLAR